MNTVRAWCLLDVLEWKCYVRLAWESFHYHHHHYHCCTEYDISRSGPADVKYLQIVWQCLLTSCCGLPIFIMMRSMISVSWWLSSTPSSVRLAVFCNVKEGIKDLYERRVRVIPWAPLPGLDDPREHWAQFEWVRQQCQYHSVLYNAIGKE